MLDHGRNNGNNDDNEKRKDQQQNNKLVQMGDAELVTFGHFALQDIAVSEELLANYGGPIWFQQRGLKLVVDDDDNDDVAKAKIDPVMEDESSNAIVDDSEIHDAAWHDL
jgi:hypothetical protein